jgi:hypothetical protein
MTDERIIELPASGADGSDETDADERRVADERPHSEGSDPRPTADEDNPLLREGADAPDAADIEDPDEQL